MAKMNHTIYIILGLLNHEELSGYDIKKRIDGMIRHFWEIGYGQIYPTLKTMEEDALIERAAAKRGRGPERSLYRITAAGQEELRRWLGLPESREYVKYEVLVKLFFGAAVPAEENRRRITAFRERHAQNAELMGVFAGNLERVLKESPDHLYYYLTVLFGEEIYGAYLRWADRALKLLEEAGEKEK
ncbi:PadR family transcriptional regulator [Paenibacillus spiritus]|uniref:PadR family transcriptional regulator n=1 Tax=Paenibacillus spiritus TaxID=2496557 RepID=A0A5J5G906_9BACL|nr:MULTISPECIES: PadR family transcriptional regulator [Paenibacillus]KAA9003953.1 PadR family transcriptional regulator [Paenibacillus spiritus]